MNEVAPPIEPAGPPGAGPLRLTLGDFKGPLEALLHLARTEGIDLSGVSMAEVARQYDAYVELARCADLEAAGEGLVLVAALIHMKSRRLLPPDPFAADPAVEESPSTQRPAGERRSVKVAAEHLQEREAAMELVFSRPAATIAEYADEQGLDADLFTLLRAFKSILGRLGDREEKRIVRERITLVERMNWLIETLQRDRRVGFRALFADATDRLTCILTFLALLEVMRLRLARAIQSHHHEDIMIILTDEAPPVSVNPESPVHA